MTKKKSALILEEGPAARIYGVKELEAIRDITDLRDGVITSRLIEGDPSVLADVQIMFSGWGAPVLDAQFLSHAAKLEAVFYGAGSIRSMVTPAFWEKGIPITSSWRANGISVAEFTEALIILSLKRFWSASRGYSSPTVARPPDVRGAYGAKVGLVSLGMIGRLVAERLKTHDLEVLAYDPFVNQEKANALCLGVRMVSLEELFATCEVVSLHAPNLPETRGMISTTLLASMKFGATFVNTARGAIVDEVGLVETLQSRPDLCAVLDVTYPEPPVEGSPLYTMPNVVLTPHIAGSLGDECYRMGQFAIEECRRFLAGRELLWSVSQKMAEVLA